MSTPKFSLSKSSNPCPSIVTYNGQKSATAQSTILQSKQTTFYKKTSFYDQALLLLIILAPLVWFQPTYANPAQQQQINPANPTHKKSESMLSTQTNNTHTSLSSTQQNQPSTPKINSNTSKHLYSLGKCGTFVYLGIITQELIERYQIFPEEAILLLPLFIPTIISLANSIHDDYSSLHYKQKGDTSATFDKVISKLRTTGKILNTIGFGTHFFIGLSNPLKKKWFTAARALIAAYSTIGFGESAYRDYKAYKQNKATKTQPNKNGITPKTITTHGAAHV